MSINTQEAMIHEANPAETAETMQLVTFRLGDESYGIEITKVREIMLMGKITQIPQTAHYVKGLINLRSTVIPVIDLKARFGLPESEQTDESRILVIHVGGNTTSIIVDEVKEVLRIGRDQIAPPPPTVANLGREYLQGLVKLDDQLLILLDIERLLGSEQIGIKA